MAVITDSRRDSWFSVQSYQPGSGASVFGSAGLEEHLFEISSESEEDDESFYDAEGHLELYLTHLPHHIHIRSIIIIIIIIVIIIIVIIIIINIIIIIIIIIISIILIILRDTSITYALLMRHLNHLDQIASESFSNSMENIGEPDNNPGY